MKKHITTAVVVFIAALSVFAQTRAVDKYAETMIEGRPFLTDETLYNSYDMGGSPIGRLDADMKRLNADLGYRQFGFGDESGSYLSGQTLRMGEPGRAFFQIFYGPDFLSREGGADADATIHRFGLAVAGQAGDGLFRGALSSEGYMGEQKWKDADRDSTRTFMGFDRIRIDLGSQVHPLVRIGFFINGTVHLDTLRFSGQDPDNSREYAVQTDLPEIGGTIEFGGEDMPVRSVLYWSNAWSRFVYGVRPQPAISPSSDPWWLRNGRGNADAIAVDSFRLDWMTHGRFSFAGDDYVVKPGLLIGFSSVSGELRVPDKENDPLKTGNTKPDREFDLGGFYFGVGSGAEILKYADLHIEYSLASMSLKVGEAYNANDFTDKRMLHHTSFGVSSSLHKYIDMPIEITPRLAYFVSGSAGIIPARHSNLDPLNNTHGGRSRENLYEPQNFLEGFVRTSGFTLGIDGSALDKMLSVSYWMTFLSKEFAGETKSGMELGLSFGLSL